MLYKLKVFWTDVGDGDGGDALEEDDDHTVFLDALDATLGTGEVAIDDLDLLGGLVEEVLVFQVDQVAAGLGGDVDEVSHLGLGDDDDFRETFFQRRMTHHVLHRHAVLVEHLQTGDLLLRVVNEEQVVDGWHQFAAAFALVVYQLVNHREVVVYMQLVEFFFDLELAAIGTVHGEPADVRGLSHRA